jgi:hypothetical protein
MDRISVTQRMGISNGKVIVIPAASLAIMSYVKIIREKMVNGKSYTL